MDSRSRWRKRVSVSRRAPEFVLVNRQVSPPSDQIVSPSSDQILSPPSDQIVSPPSDQSWKLLLLNFLMCTKFIPVN